MLPRSDASEHRVPATRVGCEGEHAFVEKRHGHPVKLRGEVLTCVLDYCQNHASAASHEVQRLVAECFGITVSVSQLNRVRATHGLSRTYPPREKKAENGPMAIGIPKPL